MFGLLRSLVTAASVFPSHVLVLGDSVTAAAQHTHTEEDTQQHRAGEERSGDKHLEQSQSIVKLNSKPRLVYEHFFLMGPFEQYEIQALKQKHDTSLRSIGFSPLPDKL